MNKVQWQDKADTYFPNGVGITQVVDVPEGPENYFMTCPNLIVLWVKYDLPYFRAYPMNINSPKDINIEVAQIDQDQPGYLDVTDVSDTQWILTPLTAPGAVAQAKSLQPEAYEEAA